MALPVSLLQVDARAVQGLGVYWRGSLCVSFRVCCVVTMLLRLPTLSEEVLQTYVYCTQLGWLESGSGFSYALGKGPWEHILGHRIVGREVGEG